MTNQEETIKFEELEQEDKDTIYNAMYDIKVEGIKEEMVYETYKHDGIDRDLLFDAIFNPSDEMDEYFENRYENDNNDTELERIKQSMRYLTNDERRGLIEYLKQSINDRTKDGFE